MRKKRFHLKPVCASLLLTFSAQGAHANPLGAAVVNGKAGFATVGNTLTVTNTPNTIINWQGFSIGANEATRFVQQSAASAVLNRVVTNNPSSILGSLQSNGRVFLVNPSGIVFGANATVNVAGMVATTLNLSNADFLAGRHNFTPVAGAQNISNAGNLTAHGDGLGGGQIYLIAPNVENTGIINAPNGEILLAAGHSVELVNSNDPNLRVNITAPAGDTTNVGQLVASSGSLGLFGTVVRNSGTVSADSATLQGGKIVFKASQRADAGGVISAKGVGGGSINVLADMQTGTVNVTGKLDASASAFSLILSPLSLPASNGGFIETSAAHVQVTDTARVTTAAPNGKSGTWLIDPVDFTIAASGGDMTGAALTLALDPTTGGNVVIQSTSGAVGTAGDVNVNDSVTWSANKLTLNAQNNININANLNGSGTASLALEYGQQAVAAGNVSKYTLNNGAQVSLPAGLNFSTLLGSDGIAIIYTVITSLGAPGSTTRTDLQGMNAKLNGKYVLGANIDATATSAWNSDGIGGYYGFTPIGDINNQFTGTFDGLGHTITNLTINLTATDFVGLFGGVQGSSVIQNVGLVGGSVNGRNFVGGLVGSIQNGTISNSYTTGSVSGNTYVGGLLGEIQNGTISNSYTTGTVNGPSYAGGLVGSSQGSMISNIYTTGSVSGNTYVGGLLGEIQNTTISNSYTAGSVSGGVSYVGGLVGFNNGGNTVSNSFWDTSGYATSPVGTGKTTAQLMQIASFSSWNTTTPNTVANTGGSGAVWRIYEGNTTPLLTSFMTGLTLNDAPDITVTYDGTTQSGASTAISGVLGAAASARNAGFYNGYYSIQQGYDITGGNLTVNTAALTLTANTDTKTYNGTISSAGAVTYTGLQAGDTITGLTQAYASKNVLGTDGSILNVNSYTINDGNMGGNYTVTTNTAVGTITQAALTVTANAATKTYNGLGYTGGNGVSYSGLMNGETSSVLTGTVAYGGSAQNAVDAGSYLITPSGLTSGNYSISYSDGALTVNKAPLTIAAIAASKTYDGLAYNGGNGVTYSGLVNGQTNAVLGGTLAYGGTSQNAVNAGSYLITPSGLTSGNYTISYANGTLTVNKAALTVAALAASKTYDGLAYSGGNGVSYSGLVNGETSSVLGGTLAYGGTSQNKVNAGSYLISPSGLNSVNYTISYTNGVLTVNKAAITAAIIGTPTKIYDGSTAATLTASNYNLSGFVTGEGASVGQTAGTYNSKDVAAATTINAILAASDFTGTGSTLLNNYTLPTSASGAGSITPIITQSAPSIATIPTPIITQSTSTLPSQPTSASVTTSPTPTITQSTSTPPTQPTSASGTTSTLPTIAPSTLTPATTVPGTNSITSGGLTVTTANTEGNINPLPTYTTAALTAGNTIVSTLSGALARLTRETEGVHSSRNGMPAANTNRTNNQKVEKRTEPAAKTNRADNQKVENHTEPVANANRADNQKVENHTEPVANTNSADNQKAENHTEPVANTNSADNQKAENRAEPAANTNSADNQKIENRAEPTAQLSADNPPSATADTPPADPGSTDKVEPIVLADAAAPASMPSAAPLPICK